MQQGAGEKEQAIADASQGPTVAVAATSELGVFGSAARVMLHGDARPMVDRLLQPLVAGQAMQGDAGLAAAARHRSGAGPGAQNRVCSALQRLPSFGEQRGEVNPPDPRKGAQDRHVALLGFLNRLALRWLLEPGAKLIELVMGRLELLVRQADRLGDGAGGDGKRLLAQNEQAVGGIEMAN